MASTPAPAPPHQVEKLIVGVDYGTTYTCVAYDQTDLNNVEASRNQSVESIQVINSWPGEGNTNEDQTPSQIAYGSGEDFPNGFRWGSDIPDSKNLVRHVWVKLLLNTPTAANSSDPSAIKPPSGHMVLPPGKSAVEVVGDFLAGVYSHVLERLSQRYGKDYVDVTPIEFVLTVPAIWSDKARSLTKEAATRAGFGSRADDTIKLVTEPEAAAIYTIKSTLDSTRSASPLQVGDSFVIVDAGGGTVDLIAYEVIQIKPDLKIIEKVLGSGGHCGSTFIDSKFHELLHKRLQKHGLSIPISKTGPGSKLMKEFETVKRAYGSGETPKTHPRYLTLNVPDHGGARIEDGELELLEEEIKETFEPVLQEIILLVNGQISEVEKQGGKVKKIFLVGGFGESDHLYKTLSKQVWGQYGQFGQLEVIRPVAARSAIARGAVMWGLHGDLVVDQRRCRRHYGTELLKHFDPMIHSEVDAMISTFSGLKMAKNQVSWIINRGDKTDSNKRFRLSCVTSFNRGEKLIHTTQLVACDADEAANNLRDKDVYDLCLLTADLSEVPEREFDECQIGNNTFLRAEFSIEMTFLPADIRFETWFKGKCYGAVRTRY